MSPTLYLLVTCTGVSNWSSVDPNEWPMMPNGGPVPAISILLHPVVTLTFEDEPFLVGLVAVKFDDATGGWPLEGDLFWRTLRFAAPDRPCKNFRRPELGLWLPEEMENFSYLLSRAGLLSIDCTFLKYFKDINKTISSLGVKRQVCDTLEPD